MEEKAKKIVDVEIEKLKIAKSSHRIDGSISVLENSIQTYGFQQPIIVDKDYNIVAGNAVYTAARNLGYKKVPCVVLSDLTEEQIKEYRIADNKTSEFASWNESKLKSELSYLENPSNLQPYFDESITKMIGFSEPVKTASPSADDIKIVKMQINQMGGESKPQNYSQPEQKTEDQIEKENNDFKNYLKSVDEGMAAKNKEYFSYNCGRCQRKVTITL